MLLSWFKMSVLVWASANSF